MFERLFSVRTRFLARWGALEALTSDGVLYGFSAFFALGLGVSSREAAQWHWGYLAIAPYALASLVAFVLGRRRLRRITMVRVALLALVVLGAVAVPLGLEARWRQLDHGVGFAQPEVSVIERSATYLSKGLDPYRVYVRNGHLVDAVPGIPAYESFFPYFPLMGVFGLPSAETHRDAGLTDARIVMSLMTLLVGGLALRLLRATPEKKIRVTQVMLALPTGALFLATGGDDMPILALSLLGVVGLQRKSAYLAAVSFGLAAAMKLTAWPLAAGALLVTRTREGRSSWQKVMVVMGVIVAASIVPFVWKNPSAFLSNVFAFPMGLAGVSSPAASPLPGHILTTLWLPLGHVLAPLTLSVGSYFVVRYLRREWPLTLVQLLNLASVMFIVTILAASATRIGYIIYPINLALWAWVCDDVPAKIEEFV